MSENKYYRPEEVDYSLIVPAYQAAFAGEPWFEVSKCVDGQRPQRCPSGLSRLAVREFCDTCLTTPQLPAYESDELIERFETLASDRPTLWYQEKLAGKTALAAIAWTAPAMTIADEKYTDNPPMRAWLEARLGNEPIVWLDEVFADKTVRQADNLRNFGPMCEGLMERLALPRIAYRTINPAMTNAAMRDFGSRATVAAREADVPDYRDFITINLEEQ